MAEHVNPLYPSIIVPLDGVIEQITEVSLRDGVVLRNLDPSELSTLNQVLSLDGGRFWGIRSLPPEIVCVESRRPPEPVDRPGDALARHHENVRRQGHTVSVRVASLLRLAQPGPIGTRLVIAPLAETIPSGYTVTQIGYLPAIVRPPRPSAYRLTAATIVELQGLFRDFYERDLNAVPGLRWLNKAYAELNTDDALAHAVFGLEQLLLRGEKERSYLSFKLALRGAWLLGTKDASREMIFTRLQRGYRLRSKIAHGDLDRELDDEELELSAALEDMLRQLVLRFLRHPEHFHQTALRRMILGLETDSRESS